MMTFHSYGSIWDEWLIGMDAVWCAHDTCGLSHAQWFSCQKMMEQTIVTS